jgi:hypothetical protein
MGVEEVVPDKRCAALWGGCIDVNDRATRRQKHVGAAWRGHRFVCEHSQQRNFTT